MPKIHQALREAVWGGWQTICPLSSFPTPIKAATIVLLIFLFAPGQQGFAGPPGLFHVPNSAYAGIWATFPYFPGGEVGRVEQLLVPIKNYMELEETVSVFIPGASNKTQLFLSFKKVFPTGSWRLVERFSSGNRNIGSAKHSAGWEVTFFPIDFPLTPVTGGWKVVYFDSSAATRKGVGMWFGITPPLR
jgi:hypothetical protein